MTVHISRQEFAAKWKKRLRPQGLAEQHQTKLNPLDVPEKVLKKRTLTNLYNDYPTWLELLHRRLDEAVLDAYGWSHDLPDEEILERLLALNLERAESPHE